MMTDAFLDEILRISAQACDRETILGRSRDSEHRLLVSLVEEIRRLRKWQEGACDVFRVVNTFIDDFAHDGGTKMIELLASAEGEVLP